MRVPGQPGQHAGKAAKAGQPGEDQATADQSRQQVEPGADGQAQDDAQRDQRAGDDLDLALELQRLGAVFHDGQAGTFPGIEPAFQDAGLAGGAGGKCRRVLARAVAGPAMEDDRGAGVGQRPGAGQPGKGDMACPRYALPRMFVGIADIDQEGALVEQGENVPGGIWRSVMMDCPGARGRRSP